MSEYSLADFIFDNMKSEGFRPSKIEGKPGEETITFVNDSEEEKVIKCGFTTRARPVKNHRVKIDRLNTLNSLPQVDGKYDTTPILTIKVDYSNKENERGNN